MRINYLLQQSDANIHFRLISPLIGEAIDHLQVKGMQVDLIRPESKEGGTD